MPATSSRSRVLVTGGAGFIGAALCHHLLAEGYPLLVVDRADGQRQTDNLRQLGAVAAPGALEVVAADLADLHLPGLLRRVSTVVHLAGRPGVQTSWADGFRGHLDDNAAVTQALLEASLDSPVRRVVVASSSSVYGEGCGSGATSEATPPRPISPYGVSKATVEMLVSAYAERGVPAVALRYFSVYGRRQRPDMAVARMVAALHGGPAFPLRGTGQQARDMTHVDDVVSATTSAMTAPLDPGTVLNVGSGRPVTLSTVLDRVAALAGRPVPLAPVRPEPGDPRRTWADHAAATHLLGWRPAVSLDDGLRDQLSWSGRLNPTHERLLR